jgi:prepilin-type N-terminal cleavage/methylation domain-containing protein
MRAAAMRKASPGFSLLELSVSMALLSIVSLLAFYALMGSTESAALAQAKSELQANLRDTMAVLTREVSTAYTERITAGDPQTLPEDLDEPITVGEGSASLTFQVPVPRAQGIPEASTPITIFFENEDTSDPPNAVLDPGEDANDDGMLNRRLVRMQDGVETTLGASNHISLARFTLLPNQNANDNRLTSLRIELEASKTFGPAGDQQKLVRGSLSSVIHLHN